MFSILKPDFMYTDISEDITENDIDVVSDLWTMDGRNVYRGSRDPRYIHANVYWLYDEHLKRVGCSEHNLKDHADFHLLWFRENDFETLLQEDGWKVKGNLWSMLPQHCFERFLNEGWTTSYSFLEQCLQGPVRIITPQMVSKLPSMYVCNACGRKSLRPIAGCALQETQLDLPDKQKILFIDDDLIVYLPCENSTIWSKLRLRHDDDSLLQEQEQEQTREQEEAQQQQEPQHVPLDPPQMKADSHNLQEQQPPAESHHGIHLLQSDAEEEILARR